MPCYVCTLLGAVPQYTPVSAHSGTEPSMSAYERVVELDHAPSIFNTVKMHN